MVGTAQDDHNESPILVNLDEFSTFLGHFEGNRGLNNISVRQWMERTQAPVLWYYIPTQDVTISNAGEAENEKLESRK